LGSGSSLTCSPSRFDLREALRCRQHCVASELANTAQSYLFQK
jgi:hypothetical protein